MLVIATQDNPARARSRSRRSAKAMRPASASWRWASMPAFPNTSPCCSRGSSESGTVDAHAIQPFYTGLLARACGLGVGLKSEADTIVVATR